MSERYDEYRGSRPRRRRGAPSRTGRKLLLWTLGVCSCILVLACGVVVVGIIVGVNWAEEKLDDYWAGQPVLITHPKGESVVGVAYSPDGGRMATLGSSGTVWIWNAETGASVLSFDAGKDPQGSLAFSPDGTGLAIGGTIWDAATGKKLITLKTSVIAFSPDGTRLASPSEASTARVWEAKTGKELLVLKGNFHFVSCVAFSPDGSRLVTGSYDGTVRLWNAATGQEERKIVIKVPKPVGPKDGDDIKEEKKPVAPKDGNDIKEEKKPVAPKDGNDIKEEEKPVRPKDGNDIKVDKPIVQRGRVLSRIQFSSDGKQIGGVDEYGFWTWDAATGEEIGSTTVQLHSEGDKIAQIAIHSGTNRLARAFDNWVTVWDLTTGKVTHQLRTKPNGSLGWSSTQLLCVAFSPDGKRIVGGSRDGTIRVWKLDK